jgi:hypothetical protein
MILCLGPTDLRLGRLATLLGRDQIAIEHLHEAVAITERMGARPYQAESRYALGALLARRGGAGDRELALAELDRALEIASEIGMAELLEDAAAARREIAAVAGDGEGAPDRTLPLGSSPRGPSM